MPTFTWDQALRGRRGQYRCRNDASSKPRRCPSIHPQHNAPSSASAMPINRRAAAAFGMMAASRARPTLPIRSQACAADAWFADSHDSHASLSGRVRIDDGSGTAIQA